MDKQKNIFVLSGGAAKGAWQYGVLRAMVLDLGIKPTAVVGTSVGAINGAGLVCNGIDGLGGIWENLRSPKDVQRSTWWKLFWMSGLYHFGPLKKLLEKNLDWTSGRLSKIPCYATYVNAVTGFTSYISQYTVDRKVDYINAILASSSVGFFHEPIKISGGLGYDGGHREILPLRFALKNFDNSYHIYAIGTSPIEIGLPLYSPSFPKIATNGLRVVEIMTNEIYKNDATVDLCRASKRVTLITPKERLAIGDMQYEPEAISRMISQGYKDGLEMLGEQS